MARDGSGTFNLPSPAFVTGTIISLTKVNANFLGIAEALTQSIAKDGQTPISADQPMGGFKHTGVGAATAADEYVDVGSYQNGKFVWGGTATGTNTITLGLTPALTAYTTGMTVRFLAAGANTGNVTINIDSLGASLGAKSLLNIGGDELSASDIPGAGALVVATYDGTNFQLHSVSKGKGAGIAFGSITRDLSAATGTVPETGLGFQPTSVIFIAGSTHIDQASIGFDDDTTDAMASLTDFPDDWSLTDDGSIRLAESSGIHQVGTISSFDSDGFTISWVKTLSPTGTGTIFYVAFR